MIGSSHVWRLECYDRLNLSNLQIQYTTPRGEERNTIEEDC